MSMDLAEDPPLLEEEEVEEQEPEVFDDKDEQGTERVSGYLKL